MGSAISESREPPRNRNDRYPEISRPVNKNNGRNGSEVSQRWKNSLDTLEFKMNAIRYAEINGNASTGRKFSVDRKRIRDWRATKEKIIELSGK